MITLSWMNYIQHWHGRFPAYMPLFQTMFNDFVKYWVDGVKMFITLLCWYAQKAQTMNLKKLHIFGLRGFVTWKSYTNDNIKCLLTFSTEMRLRRRRRRRRSVKRLGSVRKSNDKNKREMKKTNWWGLPHLLVESDEGKPMNSYPESCPLLAFSFICRYIS